MEKSVVELFAGVGGFRVGLNNVKSYDKDGHAIEENNFKFLWANQWEPATRSQEAFECYKYRFNCDETHCSNQDISVVNKKSIPKHTLLCGGFPCQDYSVAHSLSKEKGIEGKKGVLWWQINEILEEKKPPFVLLENVDRLLKSPAKQRGRDFAIMLRCFLENGYCVDWRVINAADYGHPQRRRRIYIFAYRKNTNYFKEKRTENPIDILDTTGLFAKAFPIKKINEDIQCIDIKKDYSDLVEISNSFKGNFKNSGHMYNGKVYTYDVTPECDTTFPLKNLIEKNVAAHYYLDEKKREKFAYLRGSKKIPRKKPNGEEYLYSEGAMSEFDSLDLPGRTMLTSEGTINRSTHIIKDRKGIRVLTPVECERLNQFPDNWTNTMTDRKRYFMMGNALVCGVISKIGFELSCIIDSEK